MKTIDKVLFIGSKNIGLRCLNKIYSIDKESLIGILTFNDSFDKRSEFLNFKKFAFKNKISLYIAKNKKHSEELILKIQPNLCLVVGWYWIISNRLLNTIPNGFIGIHPSLLPKYRGGSPLIWSIINGDKKIGASLFSFTANMDDGPIWSQKTINVLGTDYIKDILNKIESIAEEMINENYQKILKHQIKPKIQKQQFATYCASRITDDGLINWNSKAKDIYNFIRAQTDPYPGAFFYLNKQKIIIVKAEIDKSMRVIGMPGQVIKVNQYGIWVCCKDNYPIIITQIKIDSQMLLPSKIIKSLKIRL